MANALARYDSIELQLDIELNTQKVREVRVKGPLSARDSADFKQIESLILGKTIDEALTLKREDLSSDQKTFGSLPLWLLHRSIENYLGSEAVLAESKDRLCLCFGVGVSDIRKQILARPDYELKHLIAETFATSACGSCLHQVKKTMEDLRLSHGLIEGLTHSKGRFDKNGNWVKVKGLYPGPLLVLLDDLKKKWMEREGIADQFSIEFTGIEGLHLTVTVPGVEKDRGEKILQALSDYLKSETGVLFFLHLL